MVMAVGRANLSDTIHSQPYGSGPCICRWLDINLLENWKETKSIELLRLLS